MNVGWSGPCVVVASGPSAAQAPLELARGRARVIVVNSSWRLCPWADLLYGADYAWWAAHGGMPDFAGRKLCGQARAARESWGVGYVPVARGDDRLLTDPDGPVGRGGGAGGFQAFNLAVQSRCAPIVLIGFDGGDGAHWHGRHGMGLNNPTPHLAARWTKALNAAAPVAAALGLDVINVGAAEPRAYRRLGFAEAVALFPEPSLRGAA